MLEIVGLFVVFGVALAGSVLFDAWVVHTLYEWFVVTAFAAPKLGIAQVAGVLLVFRGARGYKVPKNDPEDKHKTSGEKMLGSVKLMVYGFAIALMTLGIGWCVRWFL